MPAIGLIVRNVWLIFGQTGLDQEKSVTLFVAQSVALYRKSVTQPRSHHQRGDGVGVFFRFQLQFLDNVRMVLWRYPRDLAGHWA